MDKAAMSHIHSRKLTYKVFHRCQLLKFHNAKETEKWRRYKYRNSSTHETQTMTNQNFLSAIKVCFAYIRT